MKVAEYENAVNKNLHELLKKEEEGKESYSLFYDLGYNFALAKDYPKAIYYYRRARKEKPWEDEAKKNLEILEKKMGIDAEEPLFVMPSTTIFYEFLAFFLVFTFISVKIRSAFYFFASCTAITLVLLFYVHFLRPPDGAVMESTYLYREEALQNALSDIVKSGETVSVIGVENEGKVLKVRDKNGAIGFVSFEKIRLF